MARYGDPTHPDVAKLNHLLQWSGRAPYDARDASSGNLLSAEDEQGLPVQDIPGNIDFLLEALGGSEPVGPTPTPEQRIGADKQNLMAVPELAQLNQLRSAAGQQPFVDASTTQGFYVTPGIDEALPLGELQEALSFYQDDAQAQAATKPKLDLHGDRDLMWAQFLMDLGIPGGQF